MGTAVLRKHDATCAIIMVYHVNILSFHDTFHHVSTLDWLSRLGTMRVAPPHGSTAVAPQLRP